MIKPFEGNYPVTQTFGVNKESYTKFNLQGHNGIDYGLPLNTSVRSPHAGKVIEAAFDAGGYGLYLKIENDKEGSVLGHLSEHYVSIGTNVGEGALIAKSGNSGNSTGPHLHHGWYMLPRDRSNGYNGFRDQEVILEGILIGYIIFFISGVVGGDWKQKYDDLNKSFTTLKTNFETFQKETADKLADAGKACLLRLQAQKDKILNLIKNYE